MQASAAFQSIRRLAIRVFDQLASISARALVSVHTAQQEFTLFIEADFAAERMTADFASLEYARFPKGPDAARRGAVAERPSGLWSSHEDEDRC